jgi:hypothetical protein
MGLKNIIRRQAPAGVKASGPGNLEAYWLHFNKLVQGRVSGSSK